MIDRFYPLADGTRVRIERETWLGETDCYLYTQRFVDGQWIDCHSAFDVCLSFPGSRSDHDISASIRAYCAAPDNRLTTTPITTNTPSIAHAPLPIAL